MTPYTKRRITRLIGCGIRQSDLFLVGYPKSGCTWLEFLFIHALLVRDEKRPVTFPDLNRLVPNLTSVLPTDPLMMWPYFARRSPRVFISHSTFDSRMLDGKVVYIIRDPRDVLVSYYQYHRTIHPDYTGSLNDFVMNSDFYPCHWDEHVGGWLLNRSHPRLCFVKYEDLKRDPRVEFARVLGEIKADASERDVARAVRRSDFKALRALEDKAPTWRRRQTPQYYHCRKGKAGGWRAEMSAEALEVVQSRYARVMQQVGYERVDPGVMAA